MKKSRMNTEITLTLRVVFKGELSLHDKIRARENLFNVIGSLYDDGLLTPDDSNIELDSWGVFQDNHRPAGLDMVGATNT
jgi:hypothetical protein